MIQIKTPQCNFFIACLTIYLSQPQNSPSSKSCKRLATVSMAASLTIHSSSFVSSTNSDIMNAFVSSPLYKQNKLILRHVYTQDLLFSVAIIFAILLCVPCSKNRDWPKMYLCLHSFCSEHGLSSTQDKTKNAVMSLKENSNDYHEP